MRVLVEFVKDMLRDFLNYIKLKIFKAEWRARNKHNFTKAGNIFPIDKVEIGKFTYGTLNINYYYAHNEFLSIGNYCSIANDVQFFTGGNHNYKNLMTYPFKNKITKNRIKEATTKGKIVIEDDVWIGYGCIILSGVTIGKGAIISAGSIVSKDIPPYAIYIRGRVEKYRFSDEIINKLIKTDFSKINEKELERKINDLYTECTDENIDKILREVIK